MVKLWKYTVNFGTMIYYGKNYSTIYTENFEIFIYYGKCCSTIPKAIVYTYKLVMRAFPEM